MTTFVIPYEGEPLIKALIKTKPLKQNLGSWQGLPIVAIGPKGGKIVGYNSGGKPIYAGSKQAKMLASISAQEGTKKTDSAGEWLLALGIKNKIKGSAVYVTPESAAVLESHFNVVGKKVGGAVEFSFTEIYAHVGEPLKPQGDEQQSWAASMASGEIDEDPFPDLGTLKQLPAGKYAGTHGNLLFEDPTGRKWIFKGEDPTIARAEEAASRIGRLIMGDRIPPARHVEIQGQPGVLVGELPGEPLNESNHSHPPLAMLQKYTGQIAQHHVVDWLTSNHDGHAGNFLSNGKDLNGIDKGQAWKFFGKDSLDADYSPNPSKPIYVAFWNAVKEGLIPMSDVLGAIGEALEKAETISDNQFKSIIAPYVSTAAGHVGFDPQKKAAAMAKRLQNLRADFESFVSGIAKHPVTFPKKSADNFETMPEVEPEKEEAKWAAIGVLSGGNYNKLKEAGWSVKWKDDVLPTDKVDQDYGAGPLPGAKATALKEKGLVVVKTGPNLTIQVPDKPKTLETTEAPVVTEEKVPGWPATKGKVTIMHPGEPSPGGTWPKGYPGPGFKAIVVYKKQPYVVDFTANMQGGIAVGVKYPDGSFGAYNSPNQASDSLYLYAKNWPLTMSATQKKKKGISLPAKKIFGIVAFKEELKKAHAGELPVAAMSPAELEKEGIVEKGAPELSAQAVLSKMPDGVVTDWDELPLQIKESLQANTFSIGTDYLHALSPAVAYKVTEDGHPVIYTVSKGSSPETLTYVSWEWDAVGNITTTHNIPKYIDGMHNFGTNSVLASIKESMTEKVAKTADEQIGAPPPAELPKEAMVPENAPKEYAGPVPPGTVITVKKKFPAGKKEVKLTVTEDGSFVVAIMDLEKKFSSLSAASDWVWVNQKGYINADIYKEKNGVNKIPSGGGWKFWGIKPGVAPKAELKVPKKEDGTPGMVSLDEFPADYALSAYPKGTVLIWQQGSGVYKAKKVEHLKWDLDTPHKGHVKGVHQSTLDSFQSTAKDIKIKVAEHKPEIHPSISEDNFETMPEIPKVEGLDGMEPGTVLEFESVSESYSATKLSNGMWKLEYSEFTEIETSEHVSGLLSYINSHEYGFEVDMKPPPSPVDVPSVAGYKDPLDGLPTAWHNLDVTISPSFIQSQPEGTQLKVNGIIYVKTGAGSAIWKDLKNDKGFFPGMFYDTIKTESIQMRVLDVDEFQKKVQSGELYVKLKKPEGQTTFDVLEQLPPNAKVKIDGVEYWHLISEGEGHWVAPDKAKFSDYHFADKVDAAAEALVMAKPSKEAKQEAPSEANWQTMPEGKTDTEYVNKLIELPVGTTLKFMSEGGKQWKAVKLSETTYNLFTPSGKQIPKGEVGMASFLLDKTNIVYDKIGSEFDPLAAILAGAEKKTYDIPAVPSTVKNVITDMKSGDVLEWKEGSQNYRLSKNGEVWNMFATGTEGKGHIVLGGDIQQAENALAYVSFDAGAFNFKLTSTKAPVVDTEWESIDKKITGQSTVKNVVEALPGTTYRFWNWATGETDVVTKVGPDKWLLASTNGYITNDEVISALNKAIGKKGSVQKKILEPKSAPKPPPVAPVKSQEQVEQEQKAKEIVDWAEAHPPVTDSGTLHVLAHVQDHFTLYDAGMGAWARMDGEHVMMGSDNPKFEKFINDLKKTSPAFEFEWVDSPIGKLARFMPESIAAALPGDPSGTFEGPDGKMYPNGTTFKEKKTTYTKEELLKQHPSFYKIKPHKEDPESVVVKVVGIGDTQKKELMEMLVSSKIPFTGDAEGFPIVGGQNVLVFVKKAELEKAGKTETTLDASIPPQPIAFKAKSIPFVSAPTGYQNPLTPADIKGVTSMVLPRMGRSLVIGKPGVFRDNHLKVRRVRGAEGKVYTEFYGTLAQSKTLSTQKGWESGTVEIPSAVNVHSDLTPFDLHNYDWDTGLSVEKPGTSPTYSESGLLNKTDGGSSIAVHRGAKSLKNMFRVRIEDGKDIEKELGDALQKMGHSKESALAPVDVDSERIWKKWSLVRGAMGPMGFQKELRNDVKETWNEEWLDSQLKALVPEYQSKLDSMVLQETFQGHPTWIVPSDVDTYRNNGWKFAQRVDSHWKSIYFQISQGAGWAAQKTKGQAGAMKMAQSGGGQSVSADVTSGGSDSIFFRAHKSWGDASSSDAVIMHPRSFLRTDWRRYYHDAYGNITGDGHGASYVQDAPGRYDALNTTGVECVWQGGAPLSDIMCVVLSHKEDKDELIALLKKDGIEQVNGVPLDDFILVGSHDLPNRIHPSLRPGPEWGDEWK